jgi:polyisoprenoid-binding protein YceI
MMKRLARSAALLIAAAAFSTLAGAAQATVWKIDPARSRLGFSGVQAGAPFKGRFGRFGAAIAFDPDRPSPAHLLVTVDLASVATGDTQRDEAWPGKDWFDTAQFPQAKFESTALHRKGPNAFEAVGVLTLRGVSHPLILPFTLDANGKSAHARGHVDLSRTAFGVGQGTWASGQWVGLAVGVDFDIVATRVS